MNATTTAPAPLTIEGILGMIINLTTALNRTADNQERLLAGQAAAIEKIEAGKGGTATTGRGRGRTKAEETPVVTDTAATNTEQQPDPAPTQTETKSFLPAIADAEALKAYVGAWTGAVEGADRASRVDLLKAIAAEFGVAPKFSDLMPHLQKTLFYIERAKAGLTVDFKADYDFDGSPSVPAAAAPAAGDDDFG